MQKANFGKDLKLWISWWRSCTKSPIARQVISLSSWIVLRQLKGLDYKNKWSIWIQRNLSLNHERKRKRITKRLPGRKHRCSLIDQAIISDDKWILRNKGLGWRSMTPCTNQEWAGMAWNSFAAFPGIFMEFFTMRFWERAKQWLLKFIPSNWLGFLTSIVSRTTKRCRSILLHDNAYPQTSCLAEDCLFALTFPSPPYIPNTVPTVFHLTGSL